MSASGVWKPNARRVISRIWVLMASTRALERPLVIAARIPAFLVGDRLGELHERRQAAASRPDEPALEQLGGLGGREPVDLAQLLFEQVGAEERPVGLLDPRELGLLAGGEVLGVLPEREAGVLELARERGQAFAARLVPDLAADLVERLGRELHDVERVEAQLGVGAALGDRPGDPGGHVARDQLQLFAALFAEPVEERLGRLAVTAGRGPDQPAVSWSTTTVRYRCPLRWLISSIPIRVSPASRSRPSAASAATRSQIPPTVRHAIRISCDDRGLRTVDREPRDLVLEAAGEPGAVTRPRHRAHHDPVAAAAHPRRLRLHDRRASFRDRASATAAAPHRDRTPGCDAGRSRSGPAPASTGRTAITSSPSLPNSTSSTTVRGSPSSRAHTLTPRTSHPLLPLPTF